MAGASLDLAAWDENEPHRFYLPDGDLEALADCFAVVDGARLPLHSQVLSLQSSVLRDCFTTVPGSSSKGAHNLSPSFEGVSLLGVACFLRLIYSPDYAHAASFAALARPSHLAAVTELAVKLGATPLLRKIATYLEGSLESFGMEALSGLLALPNDSQLVQLRERCLGRMAAKLAAAGKAGVVLLDEQQLAGYGADALARLLLQSHYGKRCPLPVRDVVDSISRSTGGFTFVVDRYSTRDKREVCSPPVEIGGYQWQLRLCLNGNSSVTGTHMSVYLIWCNASSHNTIARIEVQYAFSLINQEDEQQNHSIRFASSEFSLARICWGYHKFLALGSFRSAEHKYVKDDQLLLRVDIAVGKVTRL